MNYTHLPVNFARPTQADFEAFCDSMRELQDKKVWVHCAANMRVSAFVYKYRCETLGHEPQSARMDLDKIWRFSFKCICISVTSAILDRVVHHCQVIIIEGDSFRMKDRH